MKAMAIAVLGCVTCGIAAPDAASAQVAGERIRVTLSTTTVVGVLAAMRPNELVLALPLGGTRTVAHDEILRLERSLGARSKAMRGAKTGALLGTVVGGGLAFGLPGDCLSLGEAEDDCSNEGLAVASLALGAGLLGAGVGALSALRREESWETIAGWSSPGLGERIRVTLPSGRIVGVLAEARPDELVLALTERGDGLRPVARDGIQQLERSLGEHRQARKGAIYGALGGIALGTAGGLAIANREDEDMDEVDFAGFVYTIGLMGAGVGALAGALWKREEWETIDDRDSTGMAPRLTFDVRAGPRGRERLFVGGQLRF